MKESSKERKKCKQETIKKLNHEALFIVYKLNKLKYYVDAYPNLQFAIRENNRYILGDLNKKISLADLREFDNLVSRYKRKYGIRKLHDYTEEIIGKIK